MPSENAQNGRAFQKAASQAVVNWGKPANQARTQVAVSFGLRGCSCW